MATRRAPKAKLEEVESTRSIWVTSDETRLIVFLQEHISEAGDGGNFKKATWTAAAAHMAATTTKGGTKNHLACKNKWARVCTHNNSIF